MVDDGNPDELYAKAMDLIGWDEYSIGNGFIDTESFQYLLKAAELGHPEAQYLVGKAYVHMIPENMDLSTEYSDKGWEWYHRAADNGNQRAILIESEGEYWSGNREAARDTFLGVVNSNPTDPKVQLDIGILYLFGRVIEEDHAAAAEWIVRAADQGYAPAMAEAAWMYQHGDGVKESYERSFHYAQEGSKLGNSECILYLGRHYMCGRGTERDPEKGFGLIFEAMEKGNAYAYMEVAEAYEKGFGVEQSYVKAAEIYEKGIKDVEDVSCMIALGNLYEKGLGVEQCDSYAYDLYTMATKHILGPLAVEDLAELAREGNAIAAVVLGDSYRDGRAGLEPSREKAIELYTWPADKGYDIALVRLSKMKRDD